MSRRSVFATTALLCPAAFLLFITTLHATPPYLVPLPPTPDAPGDEVFAVALNNSGQVAGFEVNAASGAVSPIVWTAGVPAKLTVPNGYTFNGVSSINNAGSVLGSGRDAGGNSVFFLWTASGVQVIAPPAGGSYEKLNNAGHIFAAGGYDAYTPYLWSGSGFVPVPTPPNVCISGSAFNDADQVLALESTTCDFGSNAVNVVLDPNGQISTYAIPAITPAIAYQVNNRAQLGGSAGTTTGVFWDDAGTVTEIAQFATAGQINNVGAIPGSVPGPALLATYLNGEITSYPLPAVITAAHDIAINDAGQILFVFPYQNRNTVKNLYYVLTPQPKTCATDVTAVVSVNLGPITLDPATGRYNQTIQLTNTTSAAIPGPLSLAFSNLPTTVSLVVPSGATSCSSLPPGTAYTTFPGGLPANGVVDFGVLFLNLDAVPIEYAPVVLAGRGGR